MTSNIKNQVVLVNENDLAVGQMEKLEAHEKGVLHRAFSVLLFNNQGEMLLQQRALGKYHSGGLWTNTCCSHPYPDEAVIDAAHRRLNEEMGLSASLSFEFKFIYKASLDQGLTEHELDHVFIGEFNDEPIANPEEVNDWKWVNLKTLNHDLKVNSNQYTVWFKDIMKNEKMILTLSNFSR